MAREVARCAEASLQNDDSPVKRLLKRVFLSKGASLRRIPLGLARGLKMKLDFQSQFQRYLGLDERELAGYFKTCLPRCRSMVDVGANDGYYTLIFLRSPAEKIVACEPGDALRRLVENASANGYAPGDRLFVERRLIGWEPGERSLRDLVVNLPTPILIKLDIDGGEVAALESAEGMGGLNQTYWIVETHSVELERGCITWFERHGFSTEVADHAWWRRFIPELRPFGQNRWLFAQPLVGTESNRP